jgi:cyanate lyase
MVMAATWLNCSKKQYTFRQGAWEPASFILLAQPLLAFDARSADFFNNTGAAMNRMDVTEKIISTKVSKDIKWDDVAKKVGLSKEWVTAACLGQMTLDAAQADVVGDIFELNVDERKWLQVVPYKGSLPTAVPTDPLIYRWYEIVSVYGTTIKELIHEEFGDGIMSAIDFSMDIVRQPDPKGDRVNVVLSGKFLPYKQY